METENKLPAAPSAKPRVSIFDPDLDDRNADECVLARMRAFERPDLYIPNSNVVDLIISIVKAKLDAVMLIWRGKAPGSDLDTREHLEDAACWVLEIADLGGHGPDAVADALEAAARERIEVVSKFAHRRAPRRFGPKPKPVDPNAPPKRRGRKAKATPASDTLE